MRYLLAILLLFSLAACRQTQLPDPDAIRFSTDRASYAPGSDVQIRLQNGTTTRVGYNLCYSTLERRTDDAWEEVATADEVCTAILNGLEAGDEATFAKTLPVDLSEGTYRYRTDVEVMDAGVRDAVATGPFEVEL